MIRCAALLMLVALCISDLGCGKSTFAVVPNGRLEGEIAKKATKRGEFVLVTDRAGDGHLHFRDNAGTSWKIPCERLQGAWGLWVDDVDGDRRADAIVALRMRAKFDPSLENRLHVYSFERGQCVPAWRGTRLAARFDDIAVDRNDKGALLAFERSRGRFRVARYRWKGFGYGLEKVLWQGHGLPPDVLKNKFDTLREKP